jgi:hypothetical protein
VRGWLSHGSRGMRRLFASRACSSRGRSLDAFVVANGPPTERADEQGLRAPKRRPTPAKIALACWPHGTGWKPSWRACTTRRRWFPAPIILPAVSDQSIHGAMEHAGVGLVVPPPRP